MAVDPNIKKKADDIRNKIYGKEVRESLASGLEAMSSDVVENEGRQDNVESQFQDVIENTTDKDVISAPEIITARNGEANLKARLDKEHQKVTAQLAQTNDIKIGGGVKADLEDLNENVLNFIHDGTGGPIEINSIPQDYSVDFDKLNPELDGIGFPIQNEIKNGNFNDTSEWISGLSEHSTSTVENNILSNKGEGNSRVVTLRQPVPVTNTKTYAKIYVRVTNSECDFIDVFLLNGINGVGKNNRDYEQRIDFPEKDKWYEMSGIVDATNNSELFIRHTYETNEIANGSIMEVREVVLIDLTKTFGVGKEPELDYLNDLMNNLPNWFDRLNLFNARDTLNRIEKIEKQIEEPNEKSELFLLNARIDDTTIRAYTPTSTTWEGKTLVTNGDSITWYDGRAFYPSHVNEGEVAIGYQSYIRDAFNCTVLNNGISGQSMPHIYEHQVLPDDYSEIDATSITSGANDERLNVPVGTVQAKGSNFDLTTYAGALQASIEKIKTDNPNIFIFMITPIPGFFKDGRPIKRDYVNAMKEIGALYDIPICDWYDSVGVTEENMHDYLGDKLDQAYWLHPKNNMFKRMSAILLPFMVEHQPPN